jgi:UDP-N-acetyl-D-glucosamine dehydrogenase
MGLREKILDRSAKVGVVGLGYVGLPLAVEFARAGYEVYGIDVDQSRIDNIRAGNSYILDVPGTALAELVGNGRLLATTDYAVIKEIDAVSICVPTPLIKTGDPDIQYIAESTEKIREHLHPQMIVTLESTTYPGTTDEVLLTSFRSTGLEVGKDFYLAFSPERIDPGNPTWNTRNTTRIVGGTTPACTEMARLLYEQVVDRVYPVSSTRSAEMVKLLENTFRAINIGLVNEVAIMCDKLGIDVWEVIEAAATKPFGFMPFYPGPGLGGHCIPIDPLYLSWKLKLLNYHARFIELASEINTHMPEYVASKITRALNRCKKAVNGSRILVLGLSYKKNIPDTRESPSLDIIRLLQQDGAEVSYSDPYTPGLKVDHQTLRSIELTSESLRGFDCVVIVTDHSAFDYDQIIRESALVMDCRNAIRRKAPNLVRL